MAFGIGSFAGRGTLGPGKQRAFAVVSDSKGNDIHLRFHDTCMAYKVCYLSLFFCLCSILFPNSLPDPGNGCNPMSTIYGLLSSSLTLCILVLAGVLWPEEPSPISVDALALISNLLPLAELDQHMVLVCCSNQRSIECQLLRNCKLRYMSWWQRQ